MAQQQQLPFGVPAPAAAVAAAVPPAPAEKHGTLAVRHTEIPRDATGIMNLAHNWENRAVVPAAKISKLNKPLLHMITKEIRPILAEVAKMQHLKTVKGQFKGYFESSQESVRCWKKHGTHIETLMHSVVGGMMASELKKTINESVIGKLNKYLEILRTYIEEELDPKHRSAPCDRKPMHATPCLRVTEKRKEPTNPSNWVVDYGVRGPVTRVTYKRAVNGAAPTGRT